MKWSNISHNYFEVQYDKLLFISAAFCIDLRSKTVANRQNHHDVNNMLLNIIPDDCCFPWLLKKPVKLQIFEYCSVKSTRAKSSKEVQNSVRGQFAYTYVSLFEAYVVKDCLAFVEHE